MPGKKLIYLKPLPPVSTIRKYYSYDPETGIFVYAGGCHPSDVGKRACHQRDDSYCILNFFTEGGFGGAYAAHRIAWKLITGKDPAGYIDHIDGMRDNNRASNLRDVPALVNARNKHGDLWRNEMGKRRAAAMAAKMRENDKLKRDKEQRERRLLAKLKDKYESNPAE